jgi:hypothetical protein
VIGPNARNARIMGGGTGLVGMWKAFDEMEALGWIGPTRPRMVTVQPEGCAPVVRAFEAGDEFARPWEGAATIAEFSWSDYLWVYVFAAAIGFATTVAEPALIAVSLKANQVSGGTITVNGLRFSVAVGVAVGVALGAFRIVTGTPLHWYIIVGYVIVIAQTAVAPRGIIPLAYDSGGVTTSTVTVPLVAALGLGLAETIPGRSPLLDGFGLIAFASLFPMISVMAYAQLSEWRTRRAREADSTYEDTL